MSGFLRGFPKCVLATASLVAWQTAPAADSVAPGKPLELAQIFGPSAVSPERRPAIKWLPRGEAYSTLEPSREIEGASDVVRYEAKSGRRSIVISASALTPAGAARPLAITDHEWAPDAHLLLLTVAAPQARHNNPIGDCWLVDPATGALRQLGRSLPPGSLLHAEFSPDGSRVAYVSSNNLYVETVDGARALALTSDGSELLLNARGDIAYEEEFSLGKAYTWSPDSRRIAYWQFDTAGVGLFHLIRNTGGQYSKLVPQRYPKPGTINSAVRVGVVSADAPGTLWFSLAGNPRENYVPRMNWAGNGEVLIQYENRPQNTNHVLLGNATTGNLSEVMVERDDAWLMPSDEARWLAGGKQFTWLSERDGWTHLYVVTRDGQHLDLRTPGKFDVERIEAIDDKGGYAYFLASPDNVSQRYLYRATLNGAPKVERLTPVRDTGSHDYDIAPGAHWALHTVSTADTPPMIDIIHLPTHSRQRLIADNAATRALLSGTAGVRTEFFKIDIGGTVLDAWMMKPPDFDPAKKYPLLMYVYSEPAGQTVVDRWGGDRHLWHMLLAQRGYLIASVDSRGSAAPRGRDWRRSIYRQIGILASADQAAAVRGMMADRPYIDPARIGVWGWSGGGAMTLNAMFRYPDLYSTGIAIASPVDQLLYNSIYQERYMGLPAENAAGYRDGSPINFAQALRGNLLIVHGTGDDNVHYQNAEQLIDRLISLNKPFSMMAYPDRTHGIFEGANTRLHLFTMATRFLEEHLPARNTD